MSRGGNRQPKRDDRRSATIPDTTLLDKSVHFLQRRVSGKVVATPVRANSVSDAVLKCAELDNSDVIVLEASRESLL